MNQRIARKVFMRGHGGDVQRARSIVARRFHRELDRLRPRIQAPGGRIPRLLRSHRARIGRTRDRARFVAWTEVVAMADPGCRGCGGMGLVNGRYCPCASDDFVRVYHGRVEYMSGGALAWRPGLAPEEISEAAAVLHWVTFNTNRLMIAAFRHGLSGHPSGNFFGALPRQPWKITLARNLDRRR